MAAICLGLNVLIPCDLFTIDTEWDIHETEDWREFLWLYFLGPFYEYE